MTEAKALKLKNFANKVTNSMRSDFSCVAIVKSIMIFRAAFEKDMMCVLMLPGRWILSRFINSSEFLTGDSSQTYQQYIRVAMLLLHRPIIQKMYWIMIEGSRYLEGPACHTSSMETCSCYGLR